MASTELGPTSHEKAIAASKIDPADEPSVGWGWHGEARKSFQAVGWFFTAFLLLLLIGNHDGRVEDVYIIGTAVISAALLVYYAVQTKKMRRR